MSSTILIIFVILIGSECILLEAVKNNTKPIEQQKMDEEIKDIMFGMNSKINDCLTGSIKGEPINVTGIYTREDKPLWTIVIIHEDQFLHVQKCSGSLIHPQVVLTAAHCVVGKPLTELKVRAGECIKRPDAYHKERKIESIAYDKGYDPINPKRDIALIFLKEPFEINEYIKIICLPPPDVQLHVNYVKCLVSGWKRQHPSVEGHAKFRKYNVTVVPSVQCEKVLRLTSLGEGFKLHKSFMCTAGESRVQGLAVNGGAPLVCSLCGDTGQMIQIGVSSWGFRSVTLPDMFTSVKTSRIWIEERLVEKGFQLPGCGIEWY